MLAVCSTPSPIGVIITELSIDVVILPFKSSRSDIPYWNAVHFGPFVNFKQGSLDFNSGLLALLMCLGNPESQFTRSIPYIDQQPAMTDIRFTTNRIVYEEKIKKYEEILTILMNEIPQLQEMNISMIKKNRKRKVKNEEYKMNRKKPKN